MFGFALLASWSPCHDDWLNEWSSTPPVSSTMHAFTAPPPAALDTAGLAGALVAAGAELAAAEVEGAGAALVAGALLVGALLEVLFLLEQPASKIATVPVAAMIW